MTRFYWLIRRISLVAYLVFNDSILTDWFSSSGSSTKVNGVLVNPPENEIHHPKDPTCPMGLVSLYDNKLDVRIVWPN